MNNKFWQFSLFFTAAILLWACSAADKTSSSTQRSSVPQVKTSHAKTDNAAPGVVKTRSSAEKTEQEKASQNVSQNSPKADRKALKPIDGAKAYKQCAACHLPSGEGVPGAYPPLNAHIVDFSKSEAGRHYLTMVLFHGVSGDVEIDNVQYFGVMPAQPGMNTRKAAAILNYVLTGLNGVAKDSALLFKADQIGEYRAKLGSKTGNQVRKMRPVDKGELE